MRCFFNPTIALATIAALSSCPALAQNTALEFRTFPEGPIYEQEISRGLRLSDLVVHNLSIINRSDDEILIQQVSLSAMSSESPLSTQSLGQKEIEISADRFHRNQQRGVFDRLPELFGHDVMLNNGEALSPTASLAPQTALTRIQEYFAYRGQADALKVTVSYTVDDGAGAKAQPHVQSFSIPIERYQSKNSYQLPVNGRWFVSTGPDISSHHRVWQNTEFAYDFVRTNEGGKQYRNDGFAPRDYYAYGKPVFAVGGGVVMKAIDRFPDAPLRMKNEAVTDYHNRMSARMNENYANDPNANYGNIVVIDHGNGEFSSYTHLKKGSVRVKAGEQVNQGDLIGQVGQSGNSLKPHLHFAVSLSSGRSVPVTFNNARSLDDEKLQGILNEGTFIQSD